MQTAQERPGASVFASLYALESYARSLLSTVITVQALYLLGNARDVSLLFSAVGVTGLMASFSIPLLIRHLSRRWVYTLGALLIIAAAASLATHSLAGQTLGMLFRVYGTACLNITLSLYILQYIRRTELTVSEPRRMQYGAVAWVVGPALGMFLYQRFGNLAPFAVSASMSLLLIAIFWMLRLGDKPGIVAQNERSRRGPARSIGRFLAQPRLRLAWTIVFMRSSWWVFFFIYAPVYAVQHGLGEVAGAMVVSAGNAMLFVAPVAGSFARRFGVRGVLLVGYVVCGSFTLAAGVFFDARFTVIALLLLASVGTVCLDAVGNVPFLAAVRAREREEMTTVFRTYLDAAELIPPAMFALVLSFLDLRAVFLIQGCAMIAATALLQYLPARLGKTRILLRPEGPVPGTVAPIAPVGGAAGTLPTQAP
ncbi:MAG: MFS transporter [Gammaproteobacteria bacterium]